MIAPEPADGPIEVDVAILGGGPAGLAVVLALAATQGREKISVVVIDPVRRTGRDRTWCFWDTPDGDVARLVAPAVRRRWRRALVVAPAGRVLDLDLDPLRYHLVTSDDYYRLAEQAAAAIGARFVTAEATHVEPGADGVTVRLGGRPPIRARYVLDARPTPPRRPGRTRWLQHFAGWPADGVPDGDACVFMDFRAPQPTRGARGGGLAFGYVLPAAQPGGRALVEYTVFGPADGARGPGSVDYATATKQYLALPPVLGAPHADLGEPDEIGAIPMTDAAPARRTHPRVLPLGATAGATRASTGYAFAAIHRQALDVAADLRRGRPPRPRPAYPARHRWMDAVLLRALDRGGLDGVALFVRLFERHAPARVLRFLDGRTRLAEDLVLMSAAPFPTMLRAAAADAAARLGARLRRRRD